ncbi:Alpha/Beta hydrolase protein [Lipomyces oligophaga]|uniref:Alpha/Beta hydrolase protein n=1 Tax=Lipomyces oligophaga TaxID=45792 RepID=UPI0034CD604A
MVNLLSLLVSVIAVSAFSYDDLLQAPRRSPALLNPNGKQAVFSESTYSFGTHSWSGSVYLISAVAGSTISTVLQDAVDVGDFAWASDSVLVYTNTSSDYTSLWAIDVHTSKKRQIYQFEGTVSLLKTRVSGSGVRIVVSGWAKPDGSLLSPDEPKSPDTGLLYDSIFVRHWDYWLTDERNSVFGLLFSADLNSVREPFTNYLKGLGLESPIMPFPSADDVDLYDDKFVVNAKAPELTPANNTATYFYVLKYSDTNVPGIPLNKNGYGACSSPSFSKDGSKIVGLVQLENGYESDQNLVFVYDINSDGTASAAYNVTNGRQFDRSPSSVVWSPDETDTLYLIGEDLGYEVVWKLKIGGQPTKLKTTHSISSLEFVENSSKTLLLSSTGIVKSTYFELYDASSDSTRILLEAATVLSDTRVSEFWFTGSRSEQVHGFIVYPSNFDPTQKYPLAFLIHGGPQSAWVDSWSTRWNPAVWADNGPDGYIVVTINPTGSTGYGKDFCDKIQNNWGSYPYIDLVLGLEYVLANYDFIDSERMIAAGASYGGYMINWIQGSALGRVFQALVTHDGVFSTLNQYGSEELYFPTHDFGGTFMENTRGYYKYNPMNRMYRWATPHFIIHNAKDYRLPESEGLLAFNILQELGVPSKLLHFPDENHWVLKPENSRRWHKEIFAFINQYSALEPYKMVHSKRNLVRQVAQDVEGDVFF